MEFQCAAKVGASSGGGDEKIPGGLQKVYCQLRLQNASGRGEYRGILPRFAMNALTDSR